MTVVQTAPAAESVEPSELVKAIVDNVRGLREREGISARALAELMTERGVPTARNVLANLENGRRESITVDELWVLAAIFGMPPAELAGPCCWTCRGVPPAGFTCNGCGRST